MRREVAFILLLAPLALGCGDGTSSATDGGGPLVDAVSTAADLGAAPDLATAACAPIQGASYSLWPITGSPTDRPAAQHGDLNLLLRTWQPAAGAAHSLVTISGPTDPNAPKLEGLFTDGRVPSLPNVYQVQSWDWNCNCAGPYITDPEVTLAGMATAPGEVIQAPASGYSIGGGNAALVLYAAPGTITLKYTDEDNVVYGYTIHLAGICVEPELQAAYDAANAAGRSKLPAVTPRQPIGRAIGAEIQTAIRDTGSWMDPRSQKDWW